MPVASGDVVRVAVQAKFNNTEDVINVWHFVLTSGLTLNNAAALFDLEGFMDPLYTNLAQMATPETVWSGAHVVNETQNLIVGDVVFSPVIPGTATGGTLATVSSALAVMPTEVPRRQGRKYLGPLAASLIDTEGQVGTAIAGVIVSAITPYLTPIVATNGTWQLVVYSQATGTWLVPTSVKVMTAPGVQRRRKLGRGS